MGALPTSDALELVHELADDREAAERRFRLGLGLAQAAGAPVIDIAQAARLSTSRVNKILDLRGSRLKPVGDEEIEWLIENTYTAGIVPANRVALRDYDAYRAYICGARRTFRSEMDWLGFYAWAEIAPHFPKIRQVWESVQFSDDEVERRRATGRAHDVELADIIEQVLKAPGHGGRIPGNAYKVFLLTAPDDADTITLLGPIKHLERGRGTAFVRKQRYTKPSALRRQPKTTAELIKYERL
jgi:hypothetical protein